MPENRKQDNQGLMDKTLTLDDGRILAYAEYGDPDGKVVFHFHGSACSRLERPANLNILRNLGIRFVSVDRPGHGLSDPQPERRLLDWPGDIARLADSLDAGEFFVSGWSAGGPYALVCAHEMPDRVRAGAVIGGPAPPDRPSPYKGLPFTNRVMMFIMRRIPRLVVRFRRTGYNMISSHPEYLGDKLKASVPPIDREVLWELENLEVLKADISEGYRQGWDGPAQDDIIINRPWGFRLEDIRRRIDIWHGEMDGNIPFNHGQYLAEMIPDSRLNILPDFGHLLLLARWRDVLETLVK